MSDDLIRREDAIRAIKQWLDNDGSLFDVGLNQAIREIKRLPSADRPQEWIPCSERLPEIGQKVLASTKKTVFTQVFKGVYRNTDCKRWHWEHNSLKKIEAWQPLPEPWKGGANDE